MANALERKLDAEGKRLYSPDAVFAWLNSVRINSREQLF
jgi:hypothetical protein